MRATQSGFSEGGAAVPTPARVALGLLLAFVFLERVLLVLAHPDLVHDLDPGEIRHLELALFGLRQGEGLRDQLSQWLGNPDRVHHGGFGVVSLAYAGLAKLFGDSLALLRLIPILAATASAGLAALWLRRHFGWGAAVLGLALFAGAPPLVLKWTCTARGGYTEAIILLPALLILVDFALRSDRARSWFAVGLLGGFGVYFTYLAAPAMVLVIAAGLAERGRLDRLPLVVGSVVAGGLVGFLPWLLGFFALDLPYFGASLHASGRPGEAAEVVSRGLLTTLAAAWSSLPQNLWPWTVTEASAPAYATSMALADVLDYRAGPAEWAVRSLVQLSLAGTVVLGVLRRRPVLLALGLIPGLQSLIVVRLANTLSWPDVPHRYLLVAFPAIAIGAAATVTALRTSQSLSVRRLGTIGVGLLGLVAAHGIVLHLGWLGAPHPDRAAYQPEPFLEAEVGRIRVEEAPSMLALLDAPWTESSAAHLGISLIYPLSADYYLLFRERPGARPYPEALLSDRQLAAAPWEGGAGRDPAVFSGWTPESRKELVRGALAATELRLGGKTLLRETLLCSWEPGALFAEAVAEVFAEEVPDLRCYSPAESIR